MPWLCLRLQRRQLRAAHLVDGNWMSDGAGFSIARMRTWAARKTARPLRLGRLRPRLLGPRVIDDRKIYRGVGGVGVGRTLPPVLGFIETSMVRKSCAPWITRLGSTNRVSCQLRDGVRPRLRRVVPVLVRKRRRLAISRFCFGRANPAARKSRYRLPRRSRCRWPSRPSSKMPCPSPRQEIAGRKEL